MNFDELISKYLDGELTELEDTVLRQHIKEDPFKKKEFDRAVVLHYAMKEKAQEDRIPEEIARDTQDMIMMKIFNEQPVIREKLRRKTAYRRTISLIAATFILGFAAINDLSILNLNNNGLLSDKNITLQIDNEYSDLEAQTSSGNRNNKTQRNEVNLSKAQRNVGKIENGIQNSLNMAAQKEALNILNPKLSNKGQDILSLSELAASNSKPTDNESIDNSSKFAADTVIEFADAGKSTESVTSKEVNVINAMSKTIATAPMEASKIEKNFEKMKSGSFGGNQLIDMDESPVKLELTTHINTPFYSSINSVTKKSLSSSISQSFGYKLSERHGLGFEFGFMNVSYDQTIMVKTPVSSIATSINYNSGLDPNTNLLVPQPITRDERLFWGALYYKYDIYQSDIFRLNSTIGIGGTGEGLLNYGRINCSVQVLDYIILNIGVDGRLFHSSLPNNSQSPKKLQSALSLVYGLSFKL